MVDKGREMSAAFRLVGGQDKDTGERVQLAVAEIDPGVYALATVPYMWNAGSLDYDKTIQAVIEAGDLYIAVDQVEEYILDQLIQYKMDDFDVSGDPIYVGYQAKDGKYYIQRFTISTGGVDYSSGASGYGAAWVNRAAESYNDFATEF